MQKEMALGSSIRARAEAPLGFRVQGLGFRVPLCRASFEQYLSLA